MRKTGRMPPAGGSSARGAEGAAAASPGTAGAGKINVNKSTAFSETRIQQKWKQ